MGLAGERGEGGMAAYEEADDPCFDDGQVGGEDGEPRHEGRERTSGLDEMGAAEMISSLQHGSRQVLADVCRITKKRFRSLDSWRVTVKVNWQLTSSLY